MLLLRKDCQIHLDNIGLTELHIEVTNKLMAIVGECGQQVCPVKGVIFPTNKLTKVERDFAVTLLVQFLTKHKDELLAYVKARKAFKDLPEPKQPENSDGRYTGTACENTKLQYIYRKDKHNSVTISIPEALTLERLDQIQTDKEWRNQCDEYFKQYEKHNKLKTELQTMRTSLSSCNF